MSYIGLRTLTVRRVSAHLQVDTKVYTVNKHWHRQPAPQAGAGEAFMEPEGGKDGA